ncbi:unnamed protein product [Caretta caretta]
MLEQSMPHTIVPGDPGVPDHPSCSPRPHPGCVRWGLVGAAWRPRSGPTPRMKNLCSLFSAPWNFIQLF